MSAPVTWTVRDILAKSAAYLSGKDVGAARLDAERMLAEVMGCDRMELYVEPERVVGEAERARLRELVRRRGAREPVQYILGRAGFYALELRTDPRAMCPRRETELLVDRAREIAGEPADDKRVRALDLGTGSGCIALALAKNLPLGRGGGESSHVWGCDSSPDALALARENAGKLGLADRVTFLEGDLFGALKEEAETPFDLVLANLPYVPSGECDTLEPEVREHEPRLALDGGPDGLDTVRRAVAAAPPHVKPGGWILLEVGEGQAEAVTRLLADAGFETARPLRDPGGIDRVVQGRMIS